MMHTIRYLLRAGMLAMAGLVAFAPAWAQAPAITSLSVEQVAELVPGTELVFRANATANGVLRLRLVGMIASLVSKLVRWNEASDRRAAAAGIHDCRASPIP